MGRFSKNHFLKTLENYENKTNFELLNLWIGLGNYNWTNTMYFNFPEQLKPAPLNFIIKDMSNDHDISLQKDSIDFQLIDFDIF